jgi:23S rRNA (uracil1939-C5)-methyltransferase
MPESRGNSRKPPRKQKSMPGRLSDARKKAGREDFRKSAFARENKSGRGAGAERKAPAGAGQVFKAKITALSYGGYGVAKDKNGTLFVHRGLPGDEVVVRTLKYRKGYGTCEITALEKASEHRKNPGCPAFDAGCGGCQWLHLEYGQQADWKTRLVRETLKHLGKMSVEVKPVIRMESQKTFRNKLSLQLRVKEGLCGMMLENTHTILNFDKCKLVMEPCAKAYEVLKDKLSRQKIPAKITQIHVRAASDGSCGLYLFAEMMTKDIKNFADALMKDIEGLKGIGLLTWKDYRVIAGIPFIEENIRGLRFRIPHNGFFQTAYKQAGILLDLVRNFLAPDKKDNILDLYCGSGFFSLDLARQAGSVVGIENNEDSVRYAVKNAAINNIKNAQFIADDSKAGMGQFKAGDFRSAVLDPPRMGCESDALKELIRLKPQKIAYVSCAPDTLARDLLELVQNGYRIEFCQPVDMFPHTYHIETVAGLVRA